MYLSVSWYNNLLHRGNKMGVEWSIVLIIMASVYFSFYVVSETQHRVFHFFSTFFPLFFHTAIKFKSKFWREYLKPIP